MIATTYYRVGVINNGIITYSATFTVNVNPLPDYNYIRTRTVKKPGVTDKQAADGLSDVNDVEQTTTYFDGLDRSVQTVSKKTSPLGYDMVVPQAYDQFGREVMHYLPYVSPTSDGNYKSDPFSEQNAFNSVQFPGEQYFYGRTDFEPSPLNRPTANYSAGNSWIGNNRGVSTQYLINTPADSVQIWNIDFVTGSLPVNGGIYPAGQLNKTTTTDEEQHAVIEYKDKDGHVVLKKVQLWDTPAAGPSGWLNTYYVYDDMDNLRFVIPPKAVEWLMTNNWSFSGTAGSQVSTGLCFRYEYDTRNRMIIKQVPDAGETWMVYDSRDRLAMTQDANARDQGYWLVSKYDNLNRVDSTGKLVDANNRDYHQNLAASSTNYPVVNSTNYSSYIQTFYDDYSWLPGATGLNGNFSNKYISNSNYFITALNAGPVYAQPIAPSGATRGMVTGTATNIVTSTSNLYRVNFYDDRGRMIQTTSTNWEDGKDTTTIQYDFTGKPLRKLLTQNNPNANVPLYTVSTKLSYDPMGRPSSTWMRLDQATNDQLIDSLNYDELGRVSVKYLGGTPGNSLDSLVYDYNIRGWVNGINRNYVGGTTSHYFGMELGYDKGTTLASGTSFTGLQYNGNIAGAVWKSAGDGVNRKYDYSYDNVNRLTGAAYSDTLAGSWGKTKMDFTVSGLTYDANGNILSMIQNGFKIGAPTGRIDSLTYSYLWGSNKLNQVMDGANDPTSKLGDFHYNQATKQGSDYEYFPAGDQRKDFNKGYQVVSYNFLHLPELFQVWGKGQIQYIYTADGNKIMTISWDSATQNTSVTTYTEGLVYNRIDSFVRKVTAKDTLQFVPHEEGRARWAVHHYTNGSVAYGWEYDFFERDHLGNTRVLLSQEKDTAQYMATMEAAYRSKELALFYNVDSTSYPAASVPGGYPDDGTTSPNDSVARVNGNGHKMGPAILLKVMSGDSLGIGVKSFYRSNGSPGGNNNSLPDVLNSLAQGLIAVAGPGHGTAAGLENPSGGPVYAALNSFLPANETSTIGKPKAYLNWMLLDNQFNYVSGGGQSGAIPVGSADVLNALAQGIGVHHSGYLYIWVSNETQNWDVFFDNLSVCHYSGPMVEENHYYPFGLSMAGISDKALKGNYVENKYRYNDGNELQNKEFSDGSGLEMYDADFRGYDPQLGRFWQIDALADINENWSPYSFAYDNPIYFNDPSGLTPDDGDASLPAPGKVPVQPPQCLACKLPKPDPAGTVGPPPSSVPNPITPPDTRTLYEKFDQNKTIGDILYEINKFNPLANVVNAIDTYITGHDTYGVKQSNTQATIQLAAALPIGRVVNGIMIFEEAVAEGFQMEGQLATIWAEKRLFVNWLKNNHSLSRVTSPLTAVEAQQIIQNAKKLGIPLESNLNGLRGLEVTGQWAGIPHFKVGNIHVPILKGLDTILKF